MAVVCPLGFIGREVREHSDYVFFFLLTSSRLLYQAQ